MILQNTEISIELTQESIAEAISIAWIAANDLDTAHAWEVVDNKLDGMWELLLCSITPVDKSKDLRDDISMLKKIARSKSHNIHLLRLV